MAKRLKKRRDNDHLWQPQQPKPRRQPASRPGQQYLFPGSDIEQRDELRAKKRRRRRKPRTTD
jgi:hypothetical protein